MIAGTKVAQQMTQRPDCMMLGKVTADGKHVLWQEMVNEHGVESNRYGQGIRPNQPMPLTGKEKPCPAEFAHLIH